MRNPSNVNSYRNSPKLNSNDKKTGGRDQSFINELLDTVVTNQS